jgi:hypothetical protein
MDSEEPNTIQQQLEEEIADLRTQGLLPRLAGRRCTH